VTIFFRCVEQERCETGDNSKAVNTTEIDMRGAIFNLDEDMEAANNAECSKQGEICCPGKFVHPPPLECPSKTGENIKYVQSTLFDSASLTFFEIDYI
jgi:hypothetical protein